MVEGCSRRVDNVGHQDAHKQQADNRIQQNRLQSFQTVWQYAEYLAQCQNQITANEACKQRAEEAAAAGGCQKAAYDTKHQCRTLADTHCDIACQNRHHHAERQTADILEEGCQRRAAAKLSCTGKFHIEQESQCDKNTTADYKRQHMRNAIHQMLINLSPQTFLSICHVTCRLAAALACVSRNITAQNLLDKLLRLVDTISYLNEDNRLACKALHRHVLVCSHNNAFGFFYLCRRQLIFYAAAAIGFNLHCNAHLTGHLLQSLCCHIGMCNTCRAGSNSQHLALLRRLCCRCLFFLILKLFVFVFVDNCQKVLGATGIQQLAAEIIVHQQHAQVAQHIKMHIILRIRCSNQEEQLRRLAVQTVEVNAVLYQHSCQSRCLYSTCLGMRNGNAFTDTRAALLFTPQHTGSVFILIKQITASLHQRNQMLQRCCLILRLRFKINAFYLQQINYFHLIFAPSFLFISHAL